MFPFLVDPSWYQRAWLTERAPSRVVRLSLRARLVVRRVAGAMNALSAACTSLLQQASDTSPSFR